MVDGEEDWGADLSENDDAPELLAPEEYGAPDIDDDEDLDEGPEGGPDDEPRAHVSAHEVRMPPASAAALGLEPAEEEEPPPLYYETLGAFLTEYLFPLYRRQVDERSTRWCSEWFKHAEAVGRLTALWRAWEHLRLDPATGPSVWMRDHLDHHMGVLLSSEGPFKSCRAEHHEALDKLPSDPIPSGM